MKILHLTLHRRWFEEILRGTKKEEFRDITPHWNQRLIGKHYDVIRFRNGYAAHAPEMEVQLLAVTKKEHNGRECFALQLGEIISQNELATAMA